MEPMEGMSNDGNGVAAAVIVLLIILFIWLIVKITCWVAERTGLPCFGVFLLSLVPGVFFILLVLAVFNIKVANARDTAPTTVKAA